MTECWAAKRSRSARSTVTARAVVERAGASTVLGMTASARNAMVQRRTTTKPTQPRAERARRTVRRFMPPSWEVHPARGSRENTSLRWRARDVPGRQLGAGAEPEPQPDALDVRLGRPLAD